MKGRASWESRFRCMPDRLFARVPRPRYIDAIKPAEKSVVFAGAGAAGQESREISRAHMKGSNFRGNIMVEGFCIGGRHVVE